MKKNLQRITLLFCLVCLFIGRETFAADQQTITSGDWKIVYNNDTKTCDFIHKGKTILAGVFVQAKDKDQLLRSTGYGSRPSRKKLSMTFSVPAINIHLPMPDRREHLPCNSCFISILIKAIS